MIHFGGVYEALLAQHGPQRWWPADEPIEIIVGALLVQRTTWKNTELALSKLKQQGLLHVNRLAQAPIEAIEACVKPAGFYRTKSRRLQLLAAAIKLEGGIDTLEGLLTEPLRNWLLARAGIGPETADAILLYAFSRPAVVIDAYLRRLSQRLTANERAPADAKLRSLVADKISDAAALNEFHALVVAHGKNPCGTRPVCASCSLRPQCRSGLDA